MTDYILQMNNISKNFSGVKALEGVNFKVRKGSIHAIVGENGAGKSTLMNILSGVYPYGSYEGDIKYEDRICKFKSIKDSEDKGIVIIHQELALVPNLSVKENIFLGNEKANHGVIDWNQTYYEAKKYCNKVNLDVDVNLLIEQISVGKQQLVEIAKAISKNVKLLILDEPTASLNDEDSEKLLDLILELKKQEITSIIISHKLNEINKIADDITVIRDGQVVKNLNKIEDDFNEDIVIEAMVGREIVDRYPRRNLKLGNIKISVEDWTVRSNINKEKYLLDNININVRTGEVVGIAGLMGSGRTELAMSIFGNLVGNFEKGKIFIDGKEVKINNTKQAIRNRIAYVTEDRKTQGLILDQNIKNNITLSSLEKVSNNMVINLDKEMDVAKEYKKKLNIKAPSVLYNAEQLSGGNQQKIMLARWIFSDPDILILDEPTRGIDIGAKYEIYNVINELAEKGKSIILISSEMPEVIGMSDRVYVMNEGRIVAEINKDNLSQENIMKSIINSTKGESNARI
ncbi:MAG: sugar ABC transporter ATP-binding protein [Anaerococcus sp.]|nr:sugar ABC transporter ATP-binding protein [Anaerococcus sp.]